MIPPHWLSAVRYLARHPWLALLSVLGIALGVAMVVAVDLAGHSARQALVLSMESIVGRTTHHIEGGTAGVPEAVYHELRAMPNAPPMAPVVEATVSLQSHPGHSFRLLGVDPTVEAGFRGFLDRGGALDPQAAWALAMRLDSVLMLRADGERLDIEAGESLSLLLPNGRREVTVAALFSPPGTPRGLSGLMLMNIVGAQRLLEQTDRLTRIDLILPEGDVGEVVAARLRARLPAGLRLEPSWARTEALSGMLRAFNFNISALSLLALLVGMFLIYNTMSFMVVQRRPLLGTLRTLGVTRSQVFISILFESLFLGLLGTAAGLLLGLALAWFLLDLVARTINDLYFALQVSALHLSTLALAKGVALGLMGSLAAAVPPAWEAAHTPARQVLSRSALETKTRRLVPRLALAGVLGSLAALPILFWPSKDLLLAYVGLVVLVVSIGLWVPGLTMVLMGLLDRVLPADRMPSLRMAERGVVASLSRTGVAVAALTIALSTTVGMGVMIESFRSTVADWLQRTLSADVYISRGAAAPRGAVLPPGLADRVAVLPGVAQAVTWRRQRVDTEFGPLIMSGFELYPQVLEAMNVIMGDPERAFAAVKNPVRHPPAVLIGQPLAYHHDLSPGETFLIETRKGKVPFEVAAVYQDYGSDRGRMTISREVFVEYFGDVGVSGIGLYLAEDAEAQAVMARVRDLATRQTPLWVNSAAEVRRMSLEIFDRTFTITAVLRLVALVVSIIGVVSALTALQLERARELAVLRAIGMTAAQVGRMATLQSLLLGLVAGLVALPVGTALSLVLSFVINRRAFGWTIEFHPSVATLTEALLAAVLAALAAGLYPAWRMARTTPALAMREE